LVIHYKKKIEQYCMEKERLGYKRIFSTRWFVKIHRVPREHMPYVSVAMRELSREGKIREYGSRAWIWVSNGK
ncbi:MAG: hypothetical protein J7L58_01020, partial [Thermoplasmata archaeon]|nr:hypothetical protein [Thermoplasmata archaeon]